MAGAHRPAPEGASAARARRCLLCPQLRPSTRPCVIPDYPEIRPKRWRELNSSRPVKVIAVTGGKGGVGKTTVSTNLAVSIAASGPRRDAGRRRFRAGQCRCVARTAYPLSLGSCDLGPMCAGGRHRHRTARLADRAGGIGHEAHGDSVGGGACRHHPRVQRPVSPR